MDDFSKLKKEIDIVYPLWKNTILYFSISFLLQSVIIYYIIGYFIFLPIKYIFYISIISAILRAISQYIYHLIFKKDEDEVLAKLEEDEMD